MESEMRKETEDFETVESVHRDCRVLLVQRGSKHGIIAYETERRYEHMC